MKNLLLFLSFFITFAVRATGCTIFAHGIVDGPAQIQRFEQAMATSEMIALQFPDAMQASGWGLNGTIGYVTSLLGKKVNRDAMFMGQKGDIETISKAIAQIPVSNSIVLYGCSRGGAAILTYLATHSPSNISALILDACPANMPDTLHPKLAALGIAPCRADDIFTKLFPCYDLQTAITPEMAVAAIQNKKLPILLIHCKTDSVVHYTHSLRLYRQFIDAGFTNVHLVLLPQGRHSYLLQDTTLRPAYLQAVHSFYKQYSLPYDAMWAQSNTPASNCSLEMIDQTILDYDRLIQDRYLQACKRNFVLAGALIAVMIYYRFLR